MSDDRYDIDALAWSEHQATLLRRVAHGERVNDLDWPHVIEEIEEVGLSQLRACRSLLRRALVHLLKIAAWPNADAVPHRRRKTRRFLIDAADCFAPSMQQRIVLADLYRQALAQVEPDVFDNQPPAPLPGICPFAPDDLLIVPPDLALLERRLRDAERAPISP